MHCSNCGAAVTATDRFCPNCGHTMALSPGATFTGFLSAEPVAGPPQSGQVEDRGRRIIAFLIDIIPAFFLVILSFIPLLDWLGGLAGALYWLLRDINGASPGKMVLGSLVVSANGGQSSTNQRILRNVTLAIPGFIAAVPFIGIFIAAPISLMVFVTEIVMLLATGRRLGDMLANTTVIRK